ncbi:MAG: HTH domain-containing protein [Candidatus Jorgensenbacteria bacterium]|nr:HTH domain-containing protein [Candidatus Jorgensenbacteria bacterium]
MLNIDQFINELFEGFTPKQRKVLAGRFGLKNGKRATLQEIGDELGITRERVRQIEEQTIGKIRAGVREGAKELINLSIAHLESVDGVRRDDEFIKEIKAAISEIKTKYIDQKLHFIFVTAGSPLFHKEDDSFNAFWYIGDTEKKRFLDFTKQITQFFKAGDKNQILREKTYLALCKEFSSTHFLSVPKHFGVNVFGDVGLREWPEIEPKTIRDKAYLVLKKHGQPLHFESVAKFINEYGLDKKKAHMQTVHNELIKDIRFVLVGRGMYGLKEHGFEAGTVRDVIVSLLKKNGPLLSGEVVTMVNKQRFLKENTILLSLQNRKHFKRLDDGKYNIKEA